MKIDQHQVEALITPIVKAMGYDIWSIELRKVQRKVLLRLYVDLPLGDERNGVSIGDCSLISKQIGALLDVENPILDSYTLEVSSPGLDRALCKLEHYQRYVGRMIRIVLQQPENGQANFTGKIQEVSEQELQLLVNDETVTFLLTNICKANLMSDFLR